MPPLAFLPPLIPDLPHVLLHPRVLLLRHHLLLLPRLPLVSSIGRWRRLVGFQLLHVPESLPESLPLPLPLPLLLLSEPLSLSESLPLDPLDELLPLLLELLLSESLSESLRQIRPGWSVCVVDGGAKRAQDVRVDEWCGE